MAEVECPSCAKTVDLISDSTGTYECPYCHEDFHWTGQDELRQRWRSSSIARVDRKSNDFLNSLENRDAEENFEFPLLVGNFKARWKRPHAIYGLIILLFFSFLSQGDGLYVVLKRFVIPILVLQILVIAIKLLYTEFKRLKYSKEFAEKILNPEYLRGTGLEIRSNLSASLITKRRVPRYVFRKKEITKIVLHKETRGNPEAMVTPAPNYELYVYLHGVHALTIYGFDKKDSEDMVSTLMSLYDTEFQYTLHQHGGQSNSGF